MSYKTKLKIGEFSRARMKETDEGRRTEFALKLAQTKEEASAIEATAVSDLTSALKELGGTVARKRRLRILRNT